MPPCSLALPLLVCYEILLLLSDTGGAWQIRNAMDVWVRYVFHAFEIRPQHVTFVLIGILIGALVWLRLKKPEMGLPLNHAGILLLEAFIYSMVLGVLVNLLLYSSVLDLLIGNQTAQKLALSIGAGYTKNLFSSAAVKRVVLRVTPHFAKYGFNSCDCNPLRLISLCLSSLCR